MKKITQINIGAGTCGISAGAYDIKKIITDLLKRKNLNIPVIATGCAGTCYEEPIISFFSENSCSTYTNVTEKKITKIISTLFEQTSDKVPEPDFKGSYLEADFFKKQKRIVLKNCGVVDPEDFIAYKNTGGLTAVEKALLTMSQEQIIDEVKKSGLRGRGGAGFSAGLKWQLAYQENADKKYLICNADEGDPGAFMDRSILEGDPFSLIEGMIIAAYAIGASYGYIYCRAEYPLAVKRLDNALKSYSKNKYLGENILNTGYSLEINIKEGAGAFVCGEETALIHSIEGKRGMPKLRPPFPAKSGLFGYPTNINNVETLASVPFIISSGATQYAAIGTEKSKGTKVFALAGKVKNTGLVEVPMGLTLRDIIFNIGGGIKKNRSFKAVQMGGPSGGCLSADYLDIKVDYESLSSTGAIMGSGGMIVLDETTCMVDVAKYFLTFTQNESCGKCTYCRIGTRRMMEILNRITEGKAKMNDLDSLEELALNIKESSLCGLGQTSPNPVFTTLKYFRDEYIEHIVDKKCRAGLCKELITFYVNTELCRNCNICKKQCPADAINGDKNSDFTINTDNCIKCGICRDKCPFNAISTR